jgi:hypothetical protein
MPEEMKERLVNTTPAESRLCNHSERSKRRDPAATHGMSFRNSSVRGTRTVSLLRAVATAPTPCRNTSIQFTIQPNESNLTQSRSNDDTTRQRRPPDVRETRCPTFVNSRFEFPKREIVKLR